MRFQAALFCRNYHHSGGPGTSRDSWREEGHDLSPVSPKGERLLWMKCQADRLIQLSTLQLRFCTGRTAQSVAVKQGRGLLGFRQRVALLAVIAFLVNRPPVLIGLASFELHGFPANAADLESWFRGVRNVGQELLSWRESSDCLLLNLLLSIVYPDAALCAVGQ